MLLLTGPWVWTHGVEFVCVHVYHAFREELQQCNTMALSQNLFNSKYIIFIIHEKSQGQSLHRGWKRGDQPIKCLPACAACDLAAVTHCHYNRMLDSNAHYYRVQYSHKSMSKQINVRPVHGPCLNMPREQECLFNISAINTGWKTGKQMCVAGYYYRLIHTYSMYMHINTHTR